MKYPFPVGSFIWYNSSIQGIGKIIPKFSNIDVKVLTVDGHFHLSNQEPEDYILKVQDLEKMIPILGLLNTEHKEFLKEATLCCILREAENTT